MLRNKLLVNCLTVMFIILSICGCGAKSVNTANNTPETVDSKTKGYVYKANNEAMFINWTVDNNKIVGQLQITDLTNNGIQSSNHAFNGVIDGSNISLTFTGSIWTDGLSSKVFTGNLDGNNKLTLLLPASNGTMNNIQFSSGTVEDFNNTVKSFNDSYNQKQDEAKQAEQQQALQETRQKIIQNLVSSCDTLKQDESNLNNFDFSKDLDTIQKNYEKMQNDYSKLQKDASVIPLTQYQLESVVGYDLNSTLQYDLNSALQYDLNSMLEYDLNSLKDNISNVEKDISNVNSAYQNLKANKISNATYNDDVINSKISQAKDSMNAANSKISTAQNQANKIMAEAKQLYQTAQKYVSSLSPSN